MAGLVPPHQLGDAADHIVAEHHTTHAERGQGHALHEDLHAEEGHVDVAVGDDVVEQLVQVGGDRVLDLDLLLEVALVGLDVTRLVGHLGRGVVLVVDVGGAGGDLGRGHERALLAVHELAHRPRMRVGLEQPTVLVRREREAAHLGALEV